MVDFGLFNINSMILGIIATCILIFIVYRKIEFNKYVPGLICLILVFIVEVFEIREYEVFFDFLENVGILSGAILLFIAALLEYYQSSPKRKNRKEKILNEK